MDNDLIFISFSKSLTGSVAEVIYNTASYLYGSNENLFLSSLSLHGGRFTPQIQEKLKQTKIAISILSLENRYKSPWLMYEAGALALSTDANKGVLLPYLFCRHISERETPIAEHQFFQYQRDSKNNLEEFTKLFIEVNENLSPDKKIPSELKLRGKINALWKSSIDAELKILASDMYAAPSADEKSLDNITNKIIDTGSMVTESQNNVFPINDFNPRTPNDLDGQFERILNDFIPKEWKQERTKQEKEYKCTRVVINDTRISTFVVFTDGENILLFDRKAAPENTNVINERYDVFGSVQFENRTIRNKIKSEAFLSAPIKRIAPIFGAAFESNRKKEDDDLETAVMFGIVVYLEKEALLSAKKESRDTLVIYPLNAAQGLPANQLTSKADLGIKHLTQQRTA